MKLIIEIPEENYDNKTLVDYFGCYSKMLDATIYNGTPIPDKCGKIYTEKNIREQIENPYQCQTILYGLELVKPIIEAERNE